MKKVLCDENVPHGLRRYLTNHETVTAAYAGLAGIKNGALLEAASKAGFDILITGDKTLQFEQNLARRDIAIVLLSANAWRMIEPHALEIAEAVDRAEPGSFTLVDCGIYSRRQVPPPGPSTD